MIENQYDKSVSSTVRFNTTYLFIMNYFIEFRAMVSYQNMYDDNHLINCVMLQ